MDNERREYFRVTTNAFVAVALIDQEHNSIPEYFPKISQFTLHQQLEDMNNECYEQLNLLKDKVAHKILNFQNQKIDIVLKLVQQKAIEEANLVTQSIEIGEGGLSFDLTGEYPLNSNLAVMVIFTPTYKVVYSQGKLIDKSGDNRSHIQFEQLPEVQRQKLVKHLMREQTVNRPS
ncbi:MAG: hypothetical protein HRU38_06405 [Saccharospirillaceae bacterium]|nr:hypothetical protein [Pseudomonadales bacterium]NRB78286.1 hypothetical protein [Saccharospirillaceae bacterium]